MDAETWTCRQRYAVTDMQTWHGNMDIEMHGVLKGRRKPICGVKP
jgi:hypothetical protein